MTTCKYCGAILTRKAQNGKIESSRNFRKRQFCDRRCAGKFQHTKPPEQVDIREAIKDIASTDESKVRTAMEYLVDVINDKIEGADIITKVNAAKALLPFQAKKATTASGKKESRQEAAQAAASGRFGSRPAPSNIIDITAARKP